MKLKDMKDIPDADLVEIWYDCDLTLDGDEILRCPWFEAEDIADIASSGEPNNLKFAYERIGKADEFAAAMKDANAPKPQALAVLWYRQYVERVAKQVWVCFDVKPTPESEFASIWKSRWELGSVNPTNGGVFR